MSDSSDSYFCRSCGHEHPGLPNDWGFRLPDDVHALSYLDRYRRARHNSDLCTLDDQRYFIRGLLLVPFSDSDEQFGWGMWVEVDRDTHDLYVDGFDADMTAEPRRAGKLANDLPGYSTTAGVPVDVAFQDEGDRPLLWFAPQTMHALAHEQRGGITHKRQHDILRELGFFALTDPTAE